MNVSHSQLTGHLPCTAQLSTILIGLHVFFFFWCLRLEPARVLWPFPSRFCPRGIIPRCWLVVPFSVSQPLAVLRISLTVQGAPCDRVTMGRINIRHATYIYIKLMLKVLCVVPTSSQLIAGFQITAHGSDI